jgi:hypothetical protein
MAAVRSKLVVPLACLAVGLVVMLPLLAPGFVLTYDMVFVPHPRWSMELLGISPTLPRSVPTGLWVAAASAVVGGQVVQKVVLVGTFAGGAFAASRLVPARGTAARLAAGVLYVWNPFTYERLVFGHWALLLGYAILPAAVGSALRLRRGEARARWRLLLWLAACTAASPYTGVIAALVVLPVALWPGDPKPAGGTARTAATVLGASVAANLPWLVPALLHPGVPERAALASDLFGARSDSPLGTIGSLLSLGGFWNTNMAPPGRDTLAWLPVFLVVMTLAVLGIGALGRRWGRGPRNGLLAAAAVGFVLAAAPVVPGLDDVVANLSRAVPGGGILRDSQKFVIPLALLLAMGLGLGVERTLAALAARPRSQVNAVAVVLVIVPIGLAPTLAWGAAGRLGTASYPLEFDRVEAITSADPARGGILVLPWHAYVPFSWNDHHPVRQPAPFYFTRDSVSSTSLKLGPFSLPHEHPWSRLADPVVTAEPDPRHATEKLRALGIRYVLLQREGNIVEIGWLHTSLRHVFIAAADVEMFRVPGPVDVPTFRTPPVVPVVLADVAFLVLLGLAALRSRDTLRPRNAGIAPEGAAMLADAGPEGGTAG